MQCVICIMSIWLVCLLVYCTLLWFIQTQIKKLHFLAFKLITVKFYMLLKFSRCENNQLNIANDPDSVQFSSLYVKFGVVNIQLNTVKWSSASCPHSRCRQICEIWCGIENYKHGSNVKLPVFASCSASSIKNRVCCLKGFYFQWCHPYEVRLFIFLHWAVL
jgi:hypothetical protein